MYGWSENSAIQMVATARAADTADLITAAGALATAGYGSR
jgi:hypothetical protein